MEKLSFKSYVWKCVLGAEVVYAACLIYGAFLSGSTLAIHRSLFALLPGFAWGGIAGIVAGAVNLFVFALIFGSYMVWMHNSSLRSAR